MTSSLVYNLNHLSNTIDNFDAVNRDKKKFIKKCILNNCAKRKKNNKITNNFSNVVKTPTAIDAFVGGCEDTIYTRSSSLLTSFRTIKNFSANNKNKINCGNYISGVNSDRSYDAVDDGMNNHSIKCLNNNMIKKSGIISLGTIKNLIYIILFINSLKTNIILVNCLPSPYPNNNNNQQQQQQQQQQSGNIGNLESSIAAIFSKVAYGTTTKRSIPDNGFITSLTTVPTPLLTTFRYREREKEDEFLRQQQRQVPQQTLGYNNNNQQQQQIHRNYELVLEMDHALPTSAPNADILKSNNNPTYPNPNRHHNHERERHRHFNSTPSPGYNQLKKGQQPTIAMYSIDMPSYSPPSRSFFTPPLPPEYQNPFADKPTLRGTNSDSGIINTNQYINRRPLPPPSLMPGHERIPLRPPDLIGTGSGTNQGLNTGNNQEQQQQFSLSKSSNVDQQIIGILNTDNYRKKALNTPSQKVHQVDMNSNVDGRRLNNNNNNDNNNSTGETNVVHFPSISRILSGSNGRKEDIPEVLLRTVTARPNIIQQASILSLSPGHDLISVPNTNTNLNNNNNRNTIKNENDDNLHDIDDDLNGPDDVLDDDSDEDILYKNNNLHSKNNGNKGNSNGKTTDAALHINHDNQTSTTSLSTTIATTLSSGLVNENNKHKYNTLITSATSMKNNIKGNNNSNNDDINTWTIAWNIHIYLTSILFTILAVYSIFKMIFYDKLTHLFQQSYFLIINCIIIFICLLRIFYLCYDAYNINNSFNNFISELLLNIPSIFLTITFTILIMYLILKGLNNKNNKQYKILLRPITIVIIFLIHIILCITLHYVENYSTRNQLLIQQQHLLKLQQQQQHQQQTIDFKPLPRVLSLICQIIYIFVCFSLSITYLYIYKIIKRIIKKKSHNYIPSYNNFLYAIHITIGISLLFLLLSAIQIYGAIGVTKIQSSMVTNYYLQQYYNTIGLINNQHNINNSNNNFMNINNNNWLEWGYQFSIRLIEISIIVLILWVTCLKTNTIINKNTLKRCNNEQQMQQQQHPRSCSNQQQQSQHHHGGQTGQAVNNGFILFPNCTSSSSQENFDIDYPAICNTNQNLHNYTMRTGKQIYDDNFVLNTFDNININKNGELEQQQQLQQSQQLAQQQQMYPRQATAYYKTNSIVSSSSSSAATGTVMIGQKHQHKHNLDSTDCIDDDDIISLGIPDHYENPNFELKNDLHHTKRLINNKTSNNDLILDNCYSEPINVQQQTQDSYTNIVSSGAPSATAPTTLRTANGYDFQNFERPNFDRPNSRNEFRASKNLKTLKQCNSQMQQQQCDSNTIGGATTTSRYNNSGRNGNFNYNNSFDRRCIGPGTGVRKSGTLNNIGNYGRNTAVMQQQLQQQQQQQQQQQSCGGMQTLCNSRSQDRSIDFSNRRNLNTNSKRGSGPVDRGQQQLVAGQRTSLEQQLQQQVLNGHLSSSSSDLSAGDTSINGTKIYYPPNVGSVGTGIGGGVGSQQSCGSGGESSGNSGSMLVAEHGFIRFRALEDMRHQQQISNNSSIRTLGRNGGGSNCSNTGGATMSTALTTGTETSPSTTTSKKSEHHPIHP